MRKKREIFKAMQAKVEIQTIEDESASATLPSKDYNQGKGRRELHQVKPSPREKRQLMEDPPFERLQPKQSTKGASPGEAQSSEKRQLMERCFIKRGLQSHVWVIHVVPAGAGLHPLFFL